MTFTISGATDSAVLTESERIGYKEDRDLATFHFWTDKSIIDDRGLNVEQLYMEGVCTSLASMILIDEMADGGEEITITDLPNGAFNQTYYIEDFIITKYRGEPNNFYWSLLLEKS